MTGPATNKASTSAIALLRRFWVFLAPRKSWLIVGLLMIPVVAAMTTVRPLIVKHAVDVQIANDDIPGLRWVALMFLGAVVFEFTSQAVQIYALQRAGHETIADVRKAIFGHVLKLPASYYDKHPIGSLLSRTTSDVEALSETLSFGVFTILTDVVMILSILVAMFTLNAKLALISLSVAPFLYFLIRRFSEVLRRLQLEVRKAMAVRSGYLTEQLTGITVVQLFGRERAALNEYEALGGRYLRATKTANIYDSLLYSIMDGISALSIALMLWFAAPAVLGTEATADVVEAGLTVGLLYAYVDYLQRIFVPVREFSGKLATIQRAAASLERVYDLLDVPCEVRSEADEPDPLAQWPGGLEIRDLRFAYAEDGPDVLKGLSFDVAPGEVVAVVGRTGSGKSSLGRVLTRFYDGYRGSIRMPVGPGSPSDDDGVELREVAPDHLRRHLMMVQQDVFLFDDDVRFNVTLGEDLGGDAALTEALETVQAGQLVNRRGGLELQVGERGRSLSAGEAQLVAFARVAARSPNMLILDEATASVDSHTERQVQAAIEELLRGRTVLVIAHRLSTIRHADRIVVLSNGEIAEQGTHAALMAKDGLYAELYNAGFDEDAE